MLAALGEARLDDQRLAYERKYDGTLSERSGG
jgi:hypothetical protein